MLGVVCVLCCVALLCFVVCCVVVCWVVCLVVLRCGVCCVVLSCRFVMWRREEGGVTGGVVENENPPSRSGGNKNYKQIKTKNNQKMKKQKHKKRIKINEN